MLLELPRVVEIEDGFGRGFELVENEGFPLEVEIIRREVIQSKDGET